MLKPCGYIRAITARRGKISTIVRKLDIPHLRARQSKAYASHASQPRAKRQKRTVHSCRHADMCAGMHLHEVSSSARTWV
jgi:hypothetical protein